ncbi:chain length determinant protein tyrosine kinase EpsG [Chitiniphilus purpureus]|uniref:Chain length determinant protein tyrosine kinase EpsG n=1 Tax=Chitiniphilus purpureus TaxID=2981137 RepID=A0ABY6DJW4_9NEIS|nr:chain length determinant protein tyrosine kinase EpsG [Chitiniphilus sp. CD1]UXY14634.1 chain length determinant protein tyrosine kinase EpsG [Chitiniphilus sp. CD1]
MKQESLGSMLPPEARHIGRVLLEMGKLTPQQTAHILEVHQEEGLRFGQAAVRLGYLTEADLRHALAQQFSYSYLASNDSSLSPDLIAAYHPFSPAAEALRSLRSQLVLRWMAQGNKVVGLAGFDMRAATALFAANLAIVFSQLGERTLLIDANLRRPSLHDLFYTDNRQGLSDLLIGRCTEDCAQPISVLPGLALLSAGTPAPNPQELLSRAAFPQALERLAAAYDVVIVNTPPATDAADQQLIAARVRGMVLVAERHRSRWSELSQLQTQLEAAGAQIIGAVLDEGGRKK